MNRAMMFPIHAKWTKKIFDGSKKYDFRNKLPKHLKLGMKVYLYETQGKLKKATGDLATELRNQKGRGMVVSNGYYYEGDRAVVGEFTVGKIYNLTNAKYPQKVRLKTGSSSVTLIANGFSWHDYAFEITNIIQYKKPIPKEEFISWNKYHKFDKELGSHGWIYSNKEKLELAIVITAPQAPIYVVEKECE